MAHTAASAAARTSGAGSASSSRIAPVRRLDAPLSELLHGGRADVRIGVGEQVVQLGGKVDPGDVLQERDCVQGGGRISLQGHAKRADGRVARGGERDGSQIELAALERLDQAAHVLAASAEQQQDPERDQQEHR